VSRFSAGMVFLDSPFVWRRRAFLPVFSANVA
jgi:hypothetical protein